MTCQFGCQPMHQMQQKESDKESEKDDFKGYPEGSMTPSEQVLGISDRNYALFSAAPSQPTRPDRRQRDTPPPAGAVTGLCNENRRPATSSWKMLCATRNLLKLWRSRKVSWPGHHNDNGQRRLGRGGGKKTEGCPSHKPHALAGSAARSPDGNTITQFLNDQRIPSRI